MSESQRYELKRSTEKAIDQIKEAQWVPIDSILEEARRLTLQEQGRIKSTDTKAMIYLGALTAFVPLFASLTDEFSSSFQEFENWQILILVILFTITMLYLLAAGYWAFKTIQVRGFYRVDVDQLIQLNGSEQIDVALCKEILKSIRKNRDKVNNKVTSLIMAHEFLKRIFVSIILLLIWIGYVAFSLLWENQIICQIYRSIYNTSGT